MMEVELERRWTAFWKDRAAIGAPHLSEREADVVWSVLARHYREPHRAYHTLSHLAHCFTELDRIDVGGPDRDPLTLAIWFHGVIYDPQESTPGGNELGAVHEMNAVMPGDAWRVGEREEVASLILATRHEVGDSAPVDRAIAIMRDIDLSVLGQPAEVYEAYAKAIRFEYGHVPEDDYRRGRGAILKQFLLRSQVFSTASFRDRYEAQARQNLSAELEKL